MTKKITDTVFQLMLRESFSPQWDNQKNIEFRFDEKSFILEFHPPDDQLMIIKIKEFFIAANENYRYAASLIALSISARYRMIKIIGNGMHFSIFYELSFNGSVSFINDLMLALEAIEMAINEFFFRLGIFEENLGNNNTHLLNINLN